MTNFVPRRVRRLEQKPGRKLLRNLERAQLKHDATKPLLLEDLTHVKCGGRVRGAGYLNFCQTCGPVPRNEVTR